MIDDSNENAIAADIAGLPTDVRDMELNLSPDEKIRTLSLMMGIRYHVDTIIKDPRYLELMISKEKEAKFSNDPGQEHWHLRPSTARGVVGIALEFEAYLRGHHSVFAAVSFGGEEIEPVGRAQGDVQTES